MAISFTFNPFTGNFDTISTIALAAVGSTPNANGASISAGQVLTLQPASGTLPGVLTAGAQTIGGAKTFSGAISASNLSGTNTGDVTIGTANGLSLVAQALSLGLSSTSTTGALSSTDWNTFNGKQAAGNYITALTGDVTASGPGSSAATIAANVVSDTKLRQSAGLSVIGRSANSTGNVADIVAATSGNILRLNGTTLGFGSIDLSLSAAVGTSVLTVPNGGTGANTLTAFGVLYGNGTGAIAATSVGTATQVLTSNGPGVAPTFQTAASGSSQTVVTVTTTYSILSTDNLVIGNTAGGAFTVTLPTAVGISGRIYEINKGDTSSNLLTVSTTSAQTMSGLTTTKLHRVGETFSVISNGTNWTVLSNMERYERVTIDSAGAVVSQSGSWVTSAAWGPVGTLNVTAQSGIFSSVPSGLGNSANGNYICDYTPGATTTTNLRFEVSTDAGNPGNNPVTIHAIGPR